MQRKITQTIQRHGIWLALLCHLLLLSSFSLIWLPVHPMEDEKKPALDINSYVYHEKTAAPPAVQQQAAKKTPPPEKEGMEKPMANNTSASKASNQANVVKISRNENPVHLIGDKNVNKPLLVLLGKALSAHLAYPRVAVDFNLRGVVLVGFTVYPDGHLTDVQLVKSSSASVLDNAALSAVHAMSPVKNVSSYLNQPRFLVVGIIFG
ncbi:MAG: energy transducer TonB [Gammaproteobacteria bacterium]|nr:MAG: energy transducer TonB [Gammaproteobacteria bacterium]